MEVISHTMLDECLPVIVSYIYYAGAPAQCEMGGLDIVPEEPASVEIMSLTVYGADILTGIPELVLRELEQRILEDYE